MFKSKVPSLVLITMIVVLPGACVSETADAPGADAGLRDAFINRPDARGADPAEPDAEAEPDPEPAVGRCGDPPPPGAPQPPPLPAHSMGGCPTLAVGWNTLPTAGTNRDFFLVTPTDYDPAEGRLPLLVMWHHLGGAPDSMLNHGQVQASADRLRFIAAVPAANNDLAVGFGDYQFDPVWPYLNVASEGRVEQEAIFFDDMLTCIAEQFQVDESCISSVGISAGALWTAQLAQRRSERLASMILLSGGIGPATGVSLYDVRGWTGTSHAFPSLVGWGGSSDYLGVDFQKASQNLEAKLQSDGHFVMECVHNCGHGVPPVDHELGLAALYRFALDHPYWNDPGRSIYELEGVMEGTPGWCALGVGNAVPRTGSCETEPENNPSPSS